MAWGVGARIGIAASMVPELEADPSTPVDFLEVVNRITGVGPLARAKLFAQRLIAEGSGLSTADLVALHLFLTNHALHAACCTAWAALAGQQPPAGEAERAQELHAAHAQLAHALKAIPAKKVICYRACRVALSGGILHEFLRGSRHGLDRYRPGSIVLWRHAASATTDPALAEEVALRGEPASGCGIVFKIRRAFTTRPVSEFSEYPEQNETIFLPGSVFRVVGLFPCIERCIRRGSLGDSSTFAGHPWAAEVGPAIQRNDALNWEDACRSRDILVLLDEEDAAAIQRADVWF